MINSIETSRKLTWRGILVIVIFLSLIMFAHLQASAAPREYGLRVNTYPYTSDPTSLSLEDGKAIAVKGHTLKMDFLIRNRADNILGCIFRIITDVGENIDLMYTVAENDYRYPLLVTSSQTYDIDTAIPVDEWIPVSISLNPKDGAINLTYGQAGLSVRDSGTKGAKSFRIAFGYCPFVGYNLNDVASVDIKDINLTLGSKHIRQWDLSKHDGDLCYDSLKGSVARGRSPIWIIDDYISFTHVYSAEFETTPSFAFDMEDHFYMVSPDGAVRDYCVSTGTQTDYPSGNGFTPAIYPNQLVWVGEPHNKLMAYSLDENVFACYDFARRRWNNDIEVLKDHDYWNNTSLWDPSRSALIAFGGYGHYRYRNELSISYPSDPDKKIVTQLKEINPRYSVASALVRDTLYIFGGRGNKSGKQELSPHNYYDLYAVDLGSMEVTMLWNYEQIPPHGDFMPSGNMVYDQDKDCFYVATNQLGGSVIRVSRTSPEMCRMSLGVDVRPAQYSFMNLYEVKPDKKMYFVVLKGQVDGRANVDIYSINTPLIPVSELIQEGAATQRESSDRSRNVWMFVAMGLLGLLVIVLLVFNFRKRNVKQPAAEPLPEKTTPEVRTLHYDFSKSSVRFFGGFTVMDKDGNDISSKFSHTTKALFILLILYSSDGKGIAGSKLNHILWSYKPEDQANNNRNVYMSKLRPLLEEIGDVRILNQSKLWSIQFGEGSICDYIEVTNLLRENNSEKIDWILELLLKGVMLPNVEYDWADDFKSKLSNSVIDFLCGQLDRTDLSNKTLLEITDIIFKYDFLNENAMKKKCRILYKENKAGLAKSVYDTFRKDYKEALGIEFTVPFNEIV